MAKHITKYLLGLCLSAVWLSPGFFGNVLGRDDAFVSPTLSSPPPAAIEMDANLKLLSLSLKDSIVYALRNNFDIVISQLNSQIENSNVTIEKAKYDPFLQLSGSLENTEVPINSQLVGDCKRRPFPFCGTGKDGRRHNPIYDSHRRNGFSGYNIFRDYVEPNPFRLMNPSYQKLRRGKDYPAATEGGRLVLQQKPY